MNSSFLYNKTRVSNTAYYIVGKESFMAFFKKKDMEFDIDKKTHLLVLDQKWHQLFKGRKPLRIAALEKELNQLLKKQGTYTTELKEYSGLKKKMMDEIMGSMGQAHDDDDPSAKKQMERNKNYIEQINKKLEHHQAGLSDLPEKIAETNKKLVNATMKHFYHTMREKKEKAADLEKDVVRLKQEISETIIKRDEAKEEYQKLYGYIHDVVGFDIIEKYDRYYSGDSDD